MRNKIIGLVVLFMAASLVAYTLYMANPNDIKKARDYNFSMYSTEELVQLRKDMPYFTEVSSAIYYELNDRGYYNDERNNKEQKAIDVLKEHNRNKIETIDFSDPVYLNN